MVHRKEFTRETNLYGIPPGNEGAQYMFAVDSTPVDHLQLHLATRSRGRTVTRFNQIYVSSDGGQIFRGVGLIYSRERRRPIRGSNESPPYWSCRILLPYKDRLIPTDFLLDQETLTFNCPLLNAARELQISMTMLGRVGREELRDKYPGYQILKAGKKYRLQFEAYLQNRPQVLLQCG